MKTLQDVAKAYKKAAGKAIYPGSTYTSYKTGTSKAFKTGNLLSKFVTSPSNVPNSIGRENKLTEGTKYTFVLDIAPTGAEYGQYVHYGTSKMGKRPFAELGAESDEFQNALDEFLKDKVDVIATEYLDAIDTQFKKAGFTIS